MVNMGEPWMMFTYDQGLELINNTNSKWITINKVTGRKFINKTDASRYIFLPAGGYWSNDSYGATHEEDKLHGNYWSTTYYNPTYDWSYYLEFSSSSYNMSYRDYRRLGYSIRPVRPQEW